MSVGLWAGRICNAIRLCDRKCGSRSKNAIRFLGTMTTGLPFVPRCDALGVGNVSVPSLLWGVWQMRMVRTNQAKSQARRVPYLPSLRGDVTAAYRVAPDDQVQFLAAQNLPNARCPPGCDPNNAIRFWLFPPPVCLAGAFVLYKLFPLFALCKANFVGVRCTKDVRFLYTNQPKTRSLFPDRSTAFCRVGMRFDLACVGVIVVSASASIFPLCPVGTTFALMDLPICILCRWHDECSMSDPISLPVPSVFVAR